MIAADSCVVNAQSPSIPTTVQTSSNVATSPEVTKIAHKNICINSQSTTTATSATATTAFASNTEQCHQAATYGVTTSAATTADAAVKAERDTEKCCSAPWSAPWFENSVFNSRNSHHVNGYYANGFCGNNISRQSFFSMNGAGMNVRSTIERRAQQPDEEKYTASKYKYLFKVYIVQKRTVSFFCSIYTRIIVLFGPTFIY